MAELFRLVKYYNLPRYIHSYVKLPEDAFIPGIFHRFHPINGLVISCNPVMNIFKAFAVFGSVQVVGNSAVFFFFFTFFYPYRFNPVHVLLIKISQNYP